VTAIIKYDQVILVIRDIEDMGGPNIIMYEIKGSNNPGRGTSKR
jgi:hypothetical protein